MMIRKIILGIWIFNLSISISAQNKEKSNIEYADYLYTTCQYENAYKEYLRIYYNSNTTLDVQVYQRIAEKFVTVHDYPSAVKFLDIGYYAYHDQPKIQNDLLFQKVQLFISTSSYQQALVAAIQMVPEDSSRVNQKNFYIGILFFLLEKPDQGLEYVSKLSYVHHGNLDEIHQALSTYTKALKINPKNASLLSIILPGLGQTVYGNPVDGVKSFGLLTGLALLAIETSQRLSWTDALISLGPWFARYYIGGSINARKQAITFRSNKIKKSTLTIVDLLQKSQVSSVKK